MRAAFLCGEEGAAGPVPAVRKDFMGERYLTLH